MLLCQKTQNTLKFSHVYNSTILYSQNDQTGQNIEHPAVLLYANASAFTESISGVDRFVKKLGLFFVETGVKIIAYYLNKMLAAIKHVVLWVTILSFSRTAHRTCNVVQLLQRETLDFISTG